MRTRWIALCGVLCLVGLTSLTAQNGNQNGNGQGPQALVITTAAYNAASQVLTVVGENFGNGIPSVWLGTQSLTVLSSSPTILHASLLNTVAPGVHLITVSRGPGNNATGTFVISIGGAGTPGPPGPTGPQGPAGSQGLAGSPGAVGPTGPQGSQGIAGPTGAQGPQGNAGATGAQGGIGPTGPQGLQGAAGANGAPGAIGPTGPQGANGANGPPGAIGPTGPQGAAGVNGTPGAIGPTGSQGLQGAQGAQGPTGPAGPVGPTGPAAAAATCPAGYVADPDAPYICRSGFRVAAAWYPAQKDCMDEGLGAHMCSAEEIYACAGNFASVAPWINNDWMGNLAGDDMAFYVNNGADKSNFDGVTSKADLRNYACCINLSGN